MSLKVSPHILLIVCGGIAAYRALDAARQLRRLGMDVTPVMTQAAKEFVTPLSLEVLCGQPVVQELFAPGQESQIGHIALARKPDLILVCPATANLMAKMAVGLADDLPSTLLLATTAPLLLAPAMNEKMWDHPATQHNRALLQQRGVRFVGPEAGVLACGETGTGRLAEPETICAAVQKYFGAKQALSGRRVLVTAGPTVEPLDPVRFISNHSSGRQGYAIAEALAQLGAEVVLVSGPVSLAPPSAVKLVKVQTAVEMLQACQAELPVDVAICVAAVSDWRAEQVAGQKLKKDGRLPPPLRMQENPDILATLCASSARPPLVIGFAAETEHHLVHGRAKQKRKGCDWLLINDVAEGRVFGQDANQVWVLTDTTEETWPEMSKQALAEKLAAKIAGKIADCLTSPSQPSPSQTSRD